MFRDKGSDFIKGKRKAWDKKRNRENNAKAFGMSLLAFALSVAGYYLHAQYIASVVNQ